MRVHPTFARLLDTLPPAPTSPAWPLSPARAATLAAARRRMPGLLVEHGGATVRIGSLSPGCELCKAGRWVCVFLTYRCGARCAFCSAPDPPPRAPWSALGARPSEVSTRMRQLELRGAGFSGGDPFLEFAHLVEWVRYLRASQPESYLWCYTNGLAARRDRIRQLQEAGLDELRFNLAATGYSDPEVWAAVRDAAARLSCVSVEIPMIPADAPQLRRILPELVGAGVRHLILHELVVRSADAGARSCVLPSGEVLHLEATSADAALAVMEAVQDAALPISISLCSAESKAYQIQGRHRALSRALQRDYDHLTPEGLLECVWVIPWSASSAVAGAEAGVFIHPDAASSIDPSRYAAALIRLRPSLMFGAEPTIVAVEPLI